MIDKDLVKKIVEQEVEGSTMFIVEVSVHPGNRVIIEIDDENPIGIDDCISLSRKIESHFDRDVEDFELEVGSAGLTSPLRMPQQYKKNIGNEVEVLTKDGKKLHGILKSYSNEGFSISIEKKIKPEGAKKKITVEEELHFLYEDIKHTKYSIKI